MTSPILQRLVLYIPLLLSFDILSRNFASKSELGRSDDPHPVDQTEALQEVIRAMMGFSGEGPSAESNPRRSGQGQEDGGKGENRGQHRAPRYMQRLYEKYLTGEPVTADSQVADTVRNINADLAIISNASLYVFNLSSIDETETVLKAEIHIYKRRFKSEQHPKDIGNIIVKVYELGPRILRERASFRMPETGHARWHVFDATPAIRSFSQRHRSDSAPRMLAVSFVDGDAADTSGARVGSSVSLRLSKVLRKLSRPSLMVFSRDNLKNSLDGRLDTIFREIEEDDDDITGDADKESWKWNHDNPFKSRRRQLLAKSRNKDSGRSRLPDTTPEESETPTRNQLDDEIFEMDSFLDPEGRRKSDERTFRRHELEEDIGGDGRARFFHGNFSPSAASASGKSVRRRRKKRSIVDNEILQKEDAEEEKEEEEEEEEEEKEEDAVHGEPILQAYKNGLPITSPDILTGRVRSAKRTSGSTVPPPMAAFGAEPEEDSRKRRRKTEARRARERESSLAVFASRFGISRERSERERKRKAPRGQDSYSGVCRRKRLQVDFADIGWKDWIISPESFEAHYCDGTCIYPMAERLHPTNHATIQSIVRAIGLQTKVPSPCCTPSSMSSVTLLYFDRNQNVVLKNFPEMTVGACACR